MRDLSGLEPAARALIDSDRVTAPTRRVLSARLTPPEESLRALNAAQMSTLRAVAARLVPLGGLHLAERFDALLADGPGDGWRYADMPPDLQAHREALDRLAGAGFDTLDGAGRDSMLAAVQAGRAPGGSWPFPCARWFEELLAALVRLAYSHPLAQVSIGYEGFADAHGQPPSA